MQVIQQDCIFSFILIRKWQQYVLLQLTQAFLNVVLFIASREQCTLSNCLFTRALRILLQLLNCSIQQWYKMGRERNYMRFSILSCVFSYIYKILYLVILKTQVCSWWQAINVCILTWEFPVLNNIKYLVKGKFWT